MDYNKFAEANAYVMHIEKLTDILDNIRDIKKSGVIGSITINFNKDTSGYCYTLTEQQIDDLEKITEKEIKKYEEKFNNL